MKIGIITQTNQKGQIVIPKKIREALGINEKTPLNIILSDNGIHIYPIEEVITKTESESTYLEILKKTQGGWKNENWATIEKKRKKIELDASKKRKKLW